MTTTIPPQGGTELDRDFGTLRHSLRAITRDLTDLHDQVGGGDRDALVEVTRLLGEIRSCLRVALEMEVRFDLRNQTENGRDRGPDLDLEGARSSIRCRLDRLRACRGTGRIPG